MSFDTVLAATSSRRRSSSDLLALLFSLLAVAGSYWVTVRIFEGMAHLEDEMAYVWQAEVIARGELSLPSPPEPKSFLIPFVVDYQGQRFGKYPLGWPALLGVGVWMGGRDWVNPILAGLGLWLTYRLGKRIFGPLVGLLAAGLTLTSPFFWMNSGSLLSHPFSLVLSAAFALAWLDATGEIQPAKRVSPWLAALTAGLCLGVLALTRPWTAVAVGLPFGLHGLALLARGPRLLRLRVIEVGLLALGLGALNFLWQFAVTGDPFLNPYSLWWPYDKIGFGPGVGVAETGHTLSLALQNTHFSLWVGSHDLFGWFGYSWIFLPFGLLALARNARRDPSLAFQGLLVVSVFLSLVGLYLAYWIGSFLFGPRYYYEGLYSLTLLTAAGAAWLAGWPLLPGEPNHSGRSRLRQEHLRPLLVTFTAGLLVGLSLVSYTPWRVGWMHGLYEVRRADLAPFLSPQAQAQTPALVIVHTGGNWIEYGRLLELQSPFLDTPFIFIINRSSQANQTVAASFPERQVLHYYPSEKPYTLYRLPKP